MTKIPFLDLGAQYLSIRTEIDTAVSKVLASGQYVLGEEVALFEREFSDFRLFVTSRLLCGDSASMGY